MDTFHLGKPHPPKSLSTTASNTALIQKHTGQRGKQVTKGDAEDSNESKDTTDAIPILNTLWCLKCKQINSKAILCTVSRFRGHALS